MSIYCAFPKTGSLVCIAFRDLARLLAKKGYDASDEDQLAEAKSKILDYQVSMIAVRLQGQPVGSVSLQKSRGRLMRGACMTQPRCSEDEGLEGLRLM